MKMMQSRIQIIGLSFLLSLLISISRCNDIVNVGFSTLSNSSESVEKFLPPSTASTTTTEAVEPEEQLGYKNVVMNFYTTPARPTPCRYMEGTKRQNHQCRRDSGLPESLFFARQLAMSHCKDQFKFDRWNCSIELRGKRNIFKKVYKETAFVHALTAAAITYQISRACAEGKLEKCQCATERRTTAADTSTKQFRWGGCSDNLKHGKRVARNFLELQQAAADDTESEAVKILRHDGEVGISAVMNSLGDKCKCHGVSGSCSMQTCWKKLKDFNTTSAVLREKYHQAIRKISTAKALRRAANRERRERLVTIGTGFNGKNFPTISFSESLNDPGHEQLFYLEQSPTFCATSKGRQCSSPDNCSLICCGRGYSMRQIKHTEKCRCRFSNGKCCNVICDYCDRYETRYFCK